MKSIILVFLIFLSPLVGSYTYPGGGDTWDPGCGCWTNVTPPGNGGGWDGVPGDDDYDDYDRAKKNTANGVFQGISYFPIVSGDYYHFKRIVAMGAPKAVKPGKTLERAISKDGYRVIWRRDWNIGLGVGIYGEMGLGGLSIGISAKVDRGTTVNKFFKSMASAKKFKKPKIPKNLKLLNEYTVGDSIAYLTKGGVSFNAGFGFPFLKAGVSYIGQGKWGVEIQKVGPKSATVKIVRGHIHTFGVGITAITVKVGAEHFRDYDKNFFYQFDLVDKKMEEIYEQMIRGKVKNVQEFYAKNKKYQKHIRKLSEAKTRTTGFRKVRSASVPFLYSASYKKGNSYVMSNSRMLNEKMEIEEHRGVYSKETKSRGFASKAHDRISLFAGGYQKVSMFKGANKVDIQRLFATYNYSYERNKVKPKKFHKELDKIVKKFGYKGKIDFKLPQDYKGYVKMEFNAVYSEKALKKLLSMASKVERINFGNRNIKPDEYYAKLGEIAVNNYFRRVEGAYREFCRIRIKSDCLRVTRKETKKALKKAYKYLMKMNEYYAEEVEGKKFAKAFADFGKQMLENRFTFHTLMWEMRGQPVDVKLKIVGAKIRPFQMSLYSY